jgi:ABC-type transport system involved in cytochrome bd biosynthesis fused ATPase/permease subunit
MVLIDSTLSSLDAQVTRQVMERAIKGGLTADKVVLMVTNDLDLAGEMDQVLYVSEGTVK